MVPDMISHHVSCNGTHSSRRWRRYADTGPSLVTRGFSVIEGDVVQLPLEFQAQVTVPPGATENDVGVKKLFPTVMSPPVFPVGSPESEPPPPQASAASVVRPASSIRPVMFALPEGS